MFQNDTTAHRFHDDTTIGYAAKTPTIANASDMTESQKTAILQKIYHAKGAMLDAERQTSSTLKKNRDSKRYTSEELQATMNKKLDLYGPLEYRSSIIQQISCEADLEQYLHPVSVEASPLSNPQNRLLELNEKLDDMIQAWNRFIPTIAYELDTKNIINDSLKDTRKRLEQIQQDKRKAKYEAFTQTIRAHLIGAFTCVVAALRSIVASCVLGCRAAITAMTHWAVRRQPSHEGSIHKLLHQAGVEPPDSLWIQNYVPRHPYKMSYAPPKGLFTIVEEDEPSHEKDTDSEILTQLGEHSPQSGQPLTGQGNSLWLSPAPSCMPWQS